MQGVADSRTFALFAALILSTTAVTGCLGGDQGGDGDQALTIGALLPLTGDLDTYGPSGFNGAELAVKTVNANGGVNGEDVELVKADTESKENAGVSEAQRLVNVEAVHGIVGAYGSGVTKAALQQIQSFGIPMISPASTSPELQEFDDNDVFNRVVATDALQGKVMAQLAENENHTTLGILVVNNAYGNGMGDVVESEFDGVVSSYVQYNPDGTQFDSAVEEVTTPEPDAVVLVGYPDTGSQIMKTAFQKGVAGPNSSVEWLYSEGLKDTSFPDQVGQTQDGDYIVADYKGTTPAPMPQDFIDAYQQEYGTEPALFADGAYDAAAIFALASEKCDCVAGSDFKNALDDVVNEPGQNVSDLASGLEAVRNGTDVNYVGNTAAEWTEEGDMKKGVYSIWRITEDGNIEIVEPQVVP